MDVCMSRVRPTTGIAVDPFQPVLGSMASDQILEIICDGNVLRLHGSQEVLHDWIGVVPEADFDWAFETMNVPIVASSLVGFMFLHEWDQGLGIPSLHLEVVIVRRGGTGVHLGIFSISRLD